MVQHGFNQFQNIFRCMIQICIADSLFLSLLAYFDILQNGSELLRPCHLNIVQNSSERFQTIKSPELFGTIENYLELIHSLA